MSETKENKIQNIICIKNSKFKIATIGIMGITILALTIAIVLMAGSNRKSEPEILRISTLQKIINVSELSTFQVIYNGVAEVMNKEDASEVDYYVSYMSKVNAGIEFDKVEIDVSHDTKTIIVTIPQTEITDINVDITTLDYLFYNDKANNETVSQEAYKACIEDVKNESAGKKDIYELAEENAKNILKALITPFVEQLDSDYILEIN